VESVTDMHAKPECSPTHAGMLGMVRALGCTLGMRTSKGVLVTLVRMIRHSLCGRAVLAIVRI
jgi:hypothetical protein